VQIAPSAAHMAR